MCMASQNLAYSITVVRFLLTVYQCDACSFCVCIVCMYVFQHCYSVIFGLGEEKRKQEFYKARGLAEQKQGNIGHF